MSPLGRYSQEVAAGLAVFIVVAWILSTIGAGAGMIPSEPPGLRDVAMIAVGAVFGAAAAVNGVKGDINAANRRLDAINAPAAASTERSEPRH